MSPGGVPAISQHWLRGTYGRACIVHHLGIRLATGGYRTPPAQSLYAEYEEPLSLQRGELSLQLHTKIVRKSDTLTCAAVYNPSDELDALFEQHATLRPHSGRWANQLTAELLVEMPKIRTADVARATRWSLPDMKVCASITCHLKRDFPADTMHAYSLKHQETIPNLCRSTRMSHGARGAKAVQQSSRLLPSEASCPIMRSFLQEN